MRKIKRDEIYDICDVFTSMFADYDAYRLFFDESSLLKGIRAFFLYEVFTAADYTYTDDDHTVAASVKLPSDKDAPSVKFFSDPSLSREFFSVVDEKAFALAKEYFALTHRLADRYYSPETDCYVKNIGVAKEARGRGLLRKTLSELCGNRRIYLETHNAENVAIYEKLGFTLLESTDFHGVPVYAMAKEAPIALP